MSGAYDFCVTRVFENTDETFHARFRFGDIDPGKEAARVLTAQQFRAPTVVSVGVKDYDPAACPGEAIQEFTITASAEQLQNLANAIGRGDLIGAAASVAGVTVGTVVAVTDAVKGAVDTVTDFLKKPFG